MTTRTSTTATAHLGKAEGTRLVMRFDPAWIYLFDPEAGDTVAQAAASQSLRSLDVATPSGGQSYTFARSVQVDGSAPLVLDLEMTTTASKGNAVMVAALLALTAALAIFGIRRMPTA